MSAVTTGSGSAGESTSPITGAGPIRPNNRCEPPVMSSTPEILPDFARPDFTQLWIDLAQPRLGAVAIHATDEFFAPKERMIDPAPAVFIPGKYDENGKWMDGWESRR